MTYKQDPPFTIQIELTTGCNLQCPFCGINGFQEKPLSNLNFMDEETADNIAYQIKNAGWNSRLEFAMHGEPTLNPKWEEIITIFRSYLSNQIMLTSNGGPLLKGDLNDNIDGFFKAGGNILALDMYEHSKYSAQIREKLDVFDFEYAGINVYEYPENKKGNPHRRVNERFISLIADISKSTKGTHAHLQNHAGSAGLLDYSKTDKPCVKPFREMGVNSDGSVDICCNDWLGELTVGNINETAIDEIWHSELFYAVRRMLMSRNRVVRPCLGCSDMGYRVGLLPDKLGKVTLEPVDEFDIDLIEEALAKGPSRPPVGIVKKRLKNVIGR